MGKTINVGLWKNAPFLMSVSLSIDQLNSWLKKTGSDVRYEINKLDPNFTKKIDIFFLTGGADINPSRYGERNKYSSYNDKRDKIEFAMVKRSRKFNARLSGVCRGLQLLNVYYGGRLYQDIYQELDISHGGSHKALFNEDVSNLQKFIHEEKFLVSSLHHQSIKSFGRRLSPTIVDETGRIVEGIENRSNTIRALQSHPEFNKHKNDGKLFAYLMYVDIFAPEDVVSNENEYDRDIIRSLENKKLKDNYKEQRRSPSPSRRRGRSMEDITDDIRESLNIEAGRYERRENG